jgi:hypothetical protein
VKSVSDSDDSSDLVATFWSWSRDCRDSIS